MTKKYETAIIGAGTAGLTARAEVAKQTDNYVVIDGGALGTTCARCGCMPSKALIEAADLFYKQELLKQFDIVESMESIPDFKKVMSHVRGLRDRFTGGVKKGMDAWNDHLIRKHARFLDPNTLDLGDETIQANTIIIATGSMPFIPETWKKYGKYLVDTEQFFELETIPGKMAVFGLGPIGIELCQVLARLGIDVTAITLDKAIGGLTDPVMQDYTFQLFSDKFPIRIGSAEIQEENEEGLRIKCEDEYWTVDRVLTAVGRIPLLNDLGLENLGVELDDRGVPPFDKETFQIESLPVFIAGDANGFRPLLHEAADEGRIAGYNAMADKTECFKKRTYLGITFSKPNIAVIGRSYSDLQEAGIDFVIGESDYEKQSRALMEGSAEGKVRLYAHRSDDRLLGTELIAPQGEHIAHLIALAITCKMRASDVLSMPIYHPVLEEGLRKAFRQAAKESDKPKPASELLRCHDSII